MIFIAKGGHHTEAMHRVCTSIAPTHMAAAAAQPGAQSTLHPWELPAATARVHFPSDPHLLPRNATTLDDFLIELKFALDMHQLSWRPVELMFNLTHFNTDIPHPACGGLWMEFGVFQGATLNKTALFRERFCGLEAGDVWGFDTFTGLPEQWAGAFEAGAFSLGGALPPVRSNAKLAKGLFSDSLPPWMEEQRRA